VPENALTTLSLYIAIPYSTTQPGHPSVRMRNEYTSESCKKANMHTARCTSPLRTVFVATLQV